MSKVKAEKPVDPPEDSIALRVTNALIIVACIIVACIYAELPLFQTFLYVWFSLLGCYTSYYFRHGKHWWLTTCIILGLLFVVFLFGRDLWLEYNNGHLESFAPFLAVIAGMQTVHSFDLQTRGDINVSTVLSFLLFTLTAVIGRDLLFGFFVMGLVVLGSVLLYFEAVARTKANQGSTQLTQAEVTTPFPTQSRRMASGSAVLPIAALPVVTMILFASLPRVDSVVDVLFAKFHPSPITVDKEGFNFMSGTGKGSGKGTLGQGSGKDDRADKTKENNDGPKKAAESTNQNPNNINKANTTAPKTPAPTPLPQGTTSDATKSGKTEDNKDSQTGKNKATAAGKDAKGEKTNEKSADAGEKGATEKNGPNKKDGLASKNDDNGKDSSNNKDGNGGSGQPGSSGKAKKHGQGSGVGDPSEESEEEAAKKDKLANQHLTESDELIFRNQESAEFDDNVFMTIRSDQPVYLKRTVFDKYDGKHWLATVKSKSATCEKTESGWTELGGVPQLFVPSEQKSTKVLQVITANIGLGRIIPAACVPQRVDMSSKYSGAVSVDSYGVLRSDKDIAAGTVFKIESKIPTYDIKKMHEADRDAVKEKEILAKESIYLQLPDNLPPEIKKLTEEIVIADDNYFNRADRICKHLRTHFKYSNDVYKSTDNQDLVANFLFKKKEGACGEFSSAFVVMCRQAGIPARCVGGYGPGTPDGRTGGREICGQDGHAWGEVCIPNVGWVPFDATPNGTMPEGVQQDNSWFAIVRRSFDQAEAAFQSSQQDRNLGKGSEDDYKVAQRKARAQDLRKRAEENKHADDVSGAQTGQSPQNTKAESTGPKKQGGQGTQGLSPLGRTATTENDSQVVKPEPDEKAEKTANKSFTLSWQAIAFALTLIPGGFLILRLILIRMRRRAEDKRLASGSSPSTALYLKMIEDLKRLKVLRKPSDTTDELSRRFSDLLEADERIHPDLEDLFKQFIELYSQERFSQEGHNAENYKELREIGSRIHTLSKTRLEKQKN